ncbi:MAG: HPP family protein [Gammaproteobacteria bacterium]|nr:HPP family protein [Gammaproteobacteria bacterium]
MYIVSSKARQDLRPYIWQSVLATATILLILLFLDVLSHTAIIATLGSTAFLVFTRPRAYASRLRPLLGGYFIGMSVGIFFYYLSLLPSLVSLPVSTSTVYIVFSAMSVGAAIFFMVVTNTEHAPAAGMALGLVMNDWDYRTIVFIFSAVVIIAVLRQILRPFMIDLI